MNTLILSVKVFLISAGILSLSIGIKLSFPVAVNEIPAMWSVVMSWLKPPYLYLIINGIIITIAATSRFHRTPLPPVQFEHSISVRATPRQEFSSFAAQHVVRTVMEKYESNDSNDVVEVKPVMVNGLEEEIIPEIVMHESTKGLEMDIVTVPESPFVQEMISPEIRQLEAPISDKPLVASRLGHRKPIRTNPQVPVEKALRVTRPKKHETLESTWKMITEGRHVPLTRHLKKSETFEQHDGHVTGPVVDHVPKSETFNDLSGYEPSLPIRKKSSPGKDELNRRVEDFIKKFNEDMRIQRQESLNHYMETISRGV